MCVWDYLTKNVSLKIAFPNIHVRYTICGLVYHHVTTPQMRKKRHETSPPASPRTAVERAIAMWDDASDIDGTIAALWRLAALAPPNDGTVKEEMDLIESIIVNMHARRMEAIHHSSTCSSRERPYLRETQVLVDTWFAHRLKAHKTRLLDAVCASLGIERPVARCTSSAAEQ